MTKIKKVFREKGWKLACDQECLPTPGGLQDIVVNVADCTYTMYHTSLIVKFKMYRNGDIREVGYY